VRFPPGSPLPPRRSTTFSGWRIVAVASIAIGMTAPGQTPGVSVFIDPMMATLDVTRSEISTVYLIGTLVGAFMLPRFGRMFDRHGTRFTMVLVGGLLGLMLAAMSGVRGLVTLAIGFSGIRMLSQGALSLVATASIAPWFDRKRGTAVGMATAFGSIGISLMPLLSTLAILQFGWRMAWVLLAGLSWLVVVPLGIWWVIDRPSDVGQRPDGSPEPEEGEPDPADDVIHFTRREAVRTPMFWAIAGVVASTGLIQTALGFHQIDLLGDQGLTPVEAAVNFLPQTIAAVGITIVIGAMIDRVAPRVVVFGSMGLLAASMVGVGWVSPGWTAVLYGMAVGSAGSAGRTLEAAIFPRLYGLQHIGAIRGTVTMIAVGSSAFGPLILSIGRAMTGSYMPVLYALLVMPAATCVMAMVARDPRRQALEGQDRT
jgi:MFS family permease